MANPIDPRTGKPRRGRPRKSDRYDDNAATDDSSGIGSFGNSGIPESEPGTDGNPDAATDGNGSGNGRPDSGTGTGTGEEKKRSTLRQKATKLIIEKQDEKPVKTEPKQRKGKVDGAIQPEHVERWFVQGFALMAMFKEKDYWAINRPDIEVRPWAADAAEIINKVSGEQAQKIAEANAAVAVVLGVTTLVGKRMAIDTQYRKERVRARRNELMTQEGIPPENQVNPDKPATTGKTNETRSQNGYVPGSGAQPVTPEETIFGQSNGAI